MAVDNCVLYYQVLQNSQYYQANLIFKKFKGHLKTTWRALFCPRAVVWPALMFWAGWLYSIVLANWQVWTTFVPIKLIVCYFLYFERLVFFACFGTLFMIFASFWSDHDEKGVKPCFDFQTGYKVAVGCIKLTTLTIIMRTGLIIINIYLIL